MPLSKPDAIIFDLDGVVVKHNNPKLIARLERYDTAIHLVKQLFRFRGDPSIPHDMDLSVNVESNPMMHRIVHSFRRMRGQKAKDIVSPTKGIKETIDFIKQNGIKTGLVSNAHGKLYGYEVLDSFGLRDCFDSIIFRDNTKRGKPYPEGLLRCVTKLGTPKVIWYVGDQSKDIKAAMLARKKLLGKAQMEPISFGGAKSSSYYMIRKLATDKDKTGITKKHAVRNFKHMLKKLNKSS